MPAHPQLEMIYDDDCPNAELTRQRLQQAAAGIPFREWRRADPATPDYVRRFGSPTILVAGVDVAGMPPADAACCRLYRDEAGTVEGAPSVKQIRLAISAAGVTPVLAGPLGLASAGIALGMALVPVATCPACWPFWASWLGVVGNGMFGQPLVQVGIIACATLVGVIALLRGPHASWIAAVILASSGGMILLERVTDVTLWWWGGMSGFIGVSVWQIVRIARQRRDRKLACACN